MSRAEEAEKAAIQMMEQRARVVDQLSELMARALENATKKNSHEYDVISDREKNMGDGAMNKFAIAEKYIETGKTRPKEFINWLLENLPEKYKVVLQGTLRHMLEMISHYDHAQQASEWKMHMPWDKTEQMVEEDHYLKQKQAYFEKELPEVLKVLGIDKKPYMDQEMIIRAHVLEDYIKDVYEESYRENEGNKKRIDRADFLRKRQSTLDSLDFGVADYGFKFSMSGEDIEIVIRPKSEVDRLAKAAGVRDDYPFLLREDVITKSGVDYYVIDAGDEVYRDIVIYDRFLKDRILKQRQDKTLKEADKEKRESQKKESKDRMPSEPEHQRKETRPDMAENAMRAARIMNIESLMKSDGLVR